MACNRQPGPNASAPGGTQAIQRAASILRAVGAAGPRGIGLSDLARALPIERPTMHRILMCLQAEGLIGRELRNKRFFLGRAIHELGALAAPRYSLREICAASLTRLSEKTGDTVFLIGMDGADGLVLDRRDGAATARSMPVRVGMRRPLGVGAGGVAILMALRQDEAVHFVDENAGRLENHHVPTRLLLASLPKFRSRGYAMSRGYGEPPLCGVGMPLFGTSGRPAGAISVATVSPRMTVEHRRHVLSVLQSELAHVAPRLQAAEP